MTAILLVHVFACNERPRKRPLHTIIPAIMEKSDCDVGVEVLMPEARRSGLAALGHQVRTVQPRSGTFGYGQAVMGNGAGVHFGGSEPQHDGAAIPEAPPVFKKGG